MLFVFSDKFLLVLPKNVGEINVKKDGLHTIDAVHPVFPGRGGNIISDDAEPSFFADAVNNLLVFHYYQVIPEASNVLKQFPFHKQTLITKTNGIYIKSGKPGICLQKPMIVIKFQPKATCIIAIIYFLNNLPDKRGWRNTIGM